MQNKEIANLIRTGLEMDVEESHSYWLGRDEDGQCYACALGLALIGQMGVFRANVAFAENVVKNGGDNESGNSGGISSAGGVSAFY